jgi:hypothetical protein
MRDPASLDEVRFGDADVEASIEVPRIGVDDLAFEFECQLDPERRLADGCRTGNDDDAGAPFLPPRRVSR